MKTGVGRPEEPPNGEIEICTYVKNVGFTNQSQSHPGFEPNPWTMGCFSFVWRNAGIFFFKPAPFFFRQLVSGALVDIYSYLLLSSHAAKLACSNRPGWIPVQSKCHLFSLLATLEDEESFQMVTDYIRSYDLEQASTQVD